jgi:hypothetical protein
MMETGYKIGDMRNGYEVLPKEQRKTILFLSDDLRMASGIATMTKEIVLGTCHRYNFIQVGAALNHPEHGKMMDVSADVQTVTGINDADVKILAWNGYGNADLIRQLLNTFNPAAIIHFTDPRYWQFLYEIEHEIRQNCPLLYWDIWDGGSMGDELDGIPLYNAPYYASCDGLFGISKQTHSININVIERAYPDEFDIKVI